MECLTRTSAKIEVNIIHSRWSQNVLAYPVAQLFAFNLQIVQWPFSRLNENGINTYIGAQKCKWQ